MLPALPEPVLLAETLAPLVIATELAFTKIFPPAPVPCVSVKMPLPGPSMRMDWAGLLLLPCTMIFPALPVLSSWAIALIWPPLRTAKFWVSNNMSPAVPKLFCAIRLPTLFVKTCDPDSTVIFSAPLTVMVPPAPRANELVCTTDPSLILKAFAWNSMGPPPPPDTEDVSISEAVNWMLSARELSAPRMRILPAFPVLSTKPAFTLRNVNPDRFTLFPRISIAPPLPGLGIGPRFISAMIDPFDRFTVLPVIVTEPASS